MSVITGAMVSMTTVPSNAEAVPPLLVSVTMTCYEPTAMSGDDRDRTDRLAALLTGTKEGGE